MKLLTAGGLLFSAVNAATDTTNDSGMEGNYELFDYVLTINAAEPSETGALAGIGYSPVATSIVVTNDGGKIIVGYGMQTKLIALGFAISYLSQSSTKNCATTTSVISGYNTLLLKNMPNSTPSSASATLDTLALCATNTTWVYQHDVSANTCLGEECLGSSMPLFGIAEDWAHGNGAATPAAEFYLVGAIEFAGAGADFSARYGTGAYEVRVLKLDKSGTYASTWDTGNVGVTVTDLLIRSNCELPVNVTQNTSTGANCLRSHSHSAYLTARMSDNSEAGQTNNDRFLMLAGVGQSSQSPLMYKNGWQFTLGYPLLFRIHFANATSVQTTVELASAGPLPLAKDYIPSETFTPGAYTKILVDLSHDKTADAVPAVFGIKPGFENTNTNIVHAVTAAFAARDWATNINMTLTQDVMGIVIDCYGFKGAGGEEVKDESIDQLMCVGTKNGVGMIQTIPVTALAASGAVNTLTALPSAYMAADMSILTIPSGGIVNFRGTSSIGDYINQVCTSVAPHRIITNVITPDIDGWVFQCRVGIQECDRSMNAGYLTTTPELPIITSTITTTEDACYADQKYKNYRIQTFYYENKIATFKWSRQDSYYSAAQTTFTNTGSPGVVLDSSLNLNLAALASTYVFPTYDERSGIQINHFQTAGTNINPSTYMTAGVGANYLTQKSVTYESNDFCMNSNLSLLGTEDISTLSPTVTAYSDGYKAISTLSLEVFLGGAVSAWKGYCMVYYRSEFVMDAINGSVCHVAQQASDNIYDVAKHYLMHVPGNTWAPPHTQAEVQPSSLEFTDEQFSRTYDPAVATSLIYQDGYYISVWWYQPKYASSYSVVARYGKGDYVGGYCMQGVGTTSYFDPMASGVVLADAVTLAAGVVALGSSILLL